MNIVLVGPRTTNAIRNDGIMWNFFLPLQAMGHNVKLFDTKFMNKEEFMRTVKEHNTDLVFCVMTGDKMVAPNEPWSDIRSLKENDDIKTFNWFCDDSWRYDSWSSKVCDVFDFWSTTDFVSYEKYKEQFGEDRVVLTNWHSNDDLYCVDKCIKDVKVSFIGSIYPEREKKLEEVSEILDLDVHVYSNLSFEDMVFLLNRSQIVLNFSSNPNGHRPQMKGRLFEAPAARTMLVTEYVEGLENYYTDEEVLWYSSLDELKEKFDGLDWEDYADKSYDRYKKEYTSRKVLGDLLKWMM